MCFSHFESAVSTSSSGSVLHRMRSGIQKLTRVKLADNSPLSAPYRIPAKCIHVYNKKKAANVGDKILVAARGQMKKAVVVATKVPVHGTNPRVRYDDNYVVLVNDKNEPIGTRIKIPLPSTLRHLSHRYSKVLALCKRFI